MENNNQEIFNLIKAHKFDTLSKIIKDKKIKNFDIRDQNYNYLIQYIVNYNQPDILSLILNLSLTSDINIRLDILDTDGRSILYNCIRYNYPEIMDHLIKYNKDNIGISIIDIKDRLGFTALHYSVIFNNFDAFKKLLDNGGDPYIMSQDGSNVFITTLTYKRNNMIKYLLDKKFPLNFLTLGGETILQLAVNYQNLEMIDILLEHNINLNNKNSDYGLTVLHQSIIFDNIDLYKKLINKNVDINLPDFYGNTPLHYIFIDKKLDYLNLLFTKSDIKFNVANINGELPLHILLDSDIDISNINSDILDKIIIETDLNIQNNSGVTCLMKIINNNLTTRFKKILVIKPLNFFIEDNQFKQIKLTDEILDILVDSYYNQIKVNKDKLLIEWEKWCSADTFEKLQKIIKNKTAKNSEEICKIKIKEIIVTEKRTLPKVSDIDLIFDNGIFTNFCYYTGSPIDILFGLILLHKDFKNIGLSLILDYPLTINTNLENYYKKIGLDYPYKLDFSNIEIIWSYQKIFYPSYFDEVITKKLKESRYIVIPIGIETSAGSHANIILWDINKKTVERFEPNGSNYPMGLNYNPELLDSLIESKLKGFDSNINYYPPYKFLPPIGFQILENLESARCKKIGDPNGFCGVWCIWWVYQRLLNISNPHLQQKEIANEMIKYIKFDNQSFKTVIRNFSKKITQIRDSYLKKYNIDINDWIVGNYTSETLNKLEKEVFSSIIT